MSDRLPDDHVPITLATLVRLAGPVMASRLGIMAMGLVDTVCVGRYSATELGYHALGWAPSGVVLVTAIGLLGGVQVVSSQLIGEGRADATGAVLRRGLIYAFWLGIAVSAIIAGAGPWFLHRIGLATALADGAAPVMQVFAVSMLPILIADAGIFWLEAHGRPSRGMAAMWAANGVNLALNLWLVPGHSPFPVAGAVASAWATAVSRVALLAFVAGLIVYWAPSRHLGVFARPAPDPAAWPRLRRVGYASALSYFIEVSAFSGMAIVAGWMGAAAVATWAIVVNFAALVFMVPLGLATATGVLVGRAYGAGDVAGVRRAGLLGFAAALALTLTVCLGVALFSGDIAAGYTRDPGVRAAAAAALLLSCGFFVGDGLQVIGAQALRSQNDIWMPTVTHFVSYTLVMVPCALLFAVQLGHGVGGIVEAVIVASAVSALLLGGRFAWVVRRRRARTAALTV